jgi:hexokinase
MDWKNDCKVTSKAMETTAGRTASATSTMSGRVEMAEVLMRLEMAVGDGCADMVAVAVGVLVLAVGLHPETMRLKIIISGTILNIADVFMAFTPSSVDKSSISDAVI